MFVDQLQTVEDNEMNDQGRLLAKKYISSSC